MIPKKVEMMGTALFYQIRVVRHNYKVSRFRRLPTLAAYTPRFLYSTTLARLPQIGQKGYSVQYRLPTC